MDFSVVGYMLRENYFLLCFGVVMSIYLVFVVVVSIVVLVAMDQVMDVSLSW
jgi:hypothetical protein